MNCFILEMSFEMDSCDFFHLEGLKKCHAMEADWNLLGRQLGTSREPTTNDLVIKLVDS